MGIRRMMWPQQMSARPTAQGYNPKNSDKWPKFLLVLGQNGRYSNVNMNSFEISKMGFTA